MSTPSALAASLPFSLGDATCGCENELQASVLGPAEAVDLPRSIAESNYYRNMAKRERSGEMPRRVINDLEQWLESNSRGLWENSWCAWTPPCSPPWPARPGSATFWPTRSIPRAPARADAGRFSCNDGRLRLPVSYLLKLSLLDALGRPLVPAPGAAGAGPGHGRALPLGQHLAGDLLLPPEPDRRPPAREFRRRMRPAAAICSLICWPGTPRPAWAWPTAAKRWRCTFRLIPRCARSSSPSAFPTPSTESCS